MQKKKAGFVAAVSAVALIGLSAAGVRPARTASSTRTRRASLPGLNGNNAQVPVQACNNNIPVNVLGVQVPVEDAAAANGLTGGAGILGEGKAKSGDSVTDQSDNCGQEAGAGDSVN
ncbi:hypothetical protein DMP14_31155 [Pseudonocardia sp. Ae707_Ps2]|uniref:hypothetical protein n=1 Tax=Pseudonocardia sp. Ae707_Ps2 TaxID=2212992 RepID=UPI00307F201E